jgi:hypothetical protein
MITLLACLNKYTLYSVKHYTTETSVNRKPGMPVSHASTDFFLELFICIQLGISHVISVLHGLDALSRKGTLCHNYGISTDLHYQPLNKLSWQRAEG